MRAAELLFTEIPNGPALASVGVDTWYFPINLGIDSAFLDERRKYAKVGIVRDPRWTHSASEVDAMTAAERLEWAAYFAGMFSQDFTDLASPSFYTRSGRPKQCLGVYDGEYHHPDFHLAFFQAFRKLRTARAIVWTLESMQGGWFTPELVAFINNDPNIMVAPQCYYGGMQPLAPEIAVQNLVDAGIQRNKITVYLGLRDSAGVKRVVPQWWDGILYVENKLQNDTLSY